jgi:alpha-beta hydrolase superfamily lysophospholipase
MEDSYRKNGQGLQLRYRSWHVDEPVAVIALMHGQGEHIGRYDHVAAYFNERKVAVYGFDHQGHGKSDGKRGHTPNLQVLLDDIAAHVIDVREQWPQTPLFVYAHSMGGMLSLNTALHGMLDGADVRGLIATGPWIRLAFEAPPIKVLAGKLLRHVVPSLSLPTGLAAHFVSSDPEEVRKYQQDPLVHGVVSASAGISLMEGASFLDTFTGEVPFPMLIMHGTDDKLTSQPASEAFSERLTGDVTYRAWEGLYHELHNEPDQDAVLKVIWEWMALRITN